MAAADLEGLDLDTDGAEEDSAPASAALEERLLTRSAEAPLQYALGAYFWEPPEGPSFSCNIIGIAAFEGKVVVAVPHSVWHRSISRRYLPRDALSKAVAAEVPAADLEDRASSHPHFQVRVWLGLLDPSHNERCTFGPGDSDEGAERTFLVSGSAEQPAAPYGPSLLAIAQDHFAFYSAAEPAPPVQQDAQLASRVGSLETAMKQLQEGLDTVLHHVAPAAPVPEPKPATKPRPSALKTPTYGAGKPGPIPGLDPSVVTAARTAGITDAQLHRGCPGSRGWVEGQERPIVRERGRRRRGGAAAQAPLPPIHWGRQSRCRRSSQSSALQRSPTSRIS